MGPDVGLTDFDRPAAASWKKDRIGGIYDPPHGVADQRGAEAAALRHSHSQGAKVRRVFGSRSLNSPCRCVARTIASCTSGVTSSHGGDTSMSIRWKRRNGCGEHLTAARKLGH